MKASNDFFEFGSADDEGEALEPPLNGGEADFGGAKLARLNLEDGGIGGSTINEPLSIQEWKLFIN